MKEVIARVLARLIVHQPLRLWLMLALITAGSLMIVIKKGSSGFDTEVFNMLPEGFDSVKGLKFYNTGFSQSRQLSIGVIGEAGADDFEEFVDEFKEALQKEPWVLRVLHGSPLDSEKTVGDLHELMLPLILSVDPVTFAQRMQSISPENLQKRIGELRAGLDSGSPVAELELNVDPLGIVLPSIRPLLETAKALGRNGGTRDEERHFELFLVTTRQSDLSEAACIELTDAAKGFRSKMLSQWKGTPVEVVITGRAPFVAEISTSMQWDITITSTVSVLLVGLVFFLGFRRIVPLIGIIGLLALSCLAGLTFGMLVFERLNVIAIAFCSILVGLGDDFSLLLLERYRRRIEEEGGTHYDGVYAAIRDAAPSIIAVALITGVSFLSLTFSGSKGFGQLGTLIAAGVIICSVLMIVFLFLFVRRPSQTRQVQGGGIFRAYVSQVHRMPRRFLAGSATVFLIVAAISLAPQLPLRFDTNARSLEPKSSEASIALAKITDAMKFEVDPVVVIIDGSTIQEAHDRWQTMSNHLRSLEKSGQIKSFSDPAPFLFSPRDALQNSASITVEQVVASKAAFLAALEKEGLNPDSFKPSFELLDKLAECASGKVPQAQWQPTLRPESALWFLTDRYLSSHPYTAVGYLHPSERLDAPGVRDRLEASVKEAGVPVTLSGWKYTLLDLVPWAKSELYLFATAVVGMIALLLALYYRRWDLWLIHMVSLVLAVAGLIATLKLLDRPVNLLNVLAFPLMLAIGVDYGLHVLAMAKERHWISKLDSALKPIIMSGITTVSGFGSLCLAKNPALSGLGEICALGILWCVISVAGFAVPCLFALVSKGWILNDDAKMSDE